MEFNEKLQELRKQKGLTQDEVAELLFVSRTAISKWESGRGYPNIDSLKRIAKLYSVTIDELLSGDELMNIADEDSRRKERHYCDLVYGLLDLSLILFFFVPFFAQNTEGVIQEISLMSLTEIALWLRVSYFAVIIGSIVFGVLTLAMQNCEKLFWIRYKNKISLTLNIIGAFMLIISLQPYAASYLFVCLVIKVLMLVNYK
ncbi:MAG: helix-turn-helix transcriptional regulator [Ruminococcaceae bacterium]|nr:helix-turn-helix transcriptional regulator [Oscillospiraceae bacterium]